MSSQVFRLLFNNKNVILRGYSGIYQKRLLSTSLKDPYKVVSSNTEKSESSKTSSSTPLSKPSKVRKYGMYVLAFLVGAGSYLGYNVYTGFNDDKPDLSEKAQSYKPGNLKKASKTINRGVSNPAGIKLTLYQYASCPFCCKVRAYLDYYGYNYDIVEVNSLNHNQIKWSDYKKVPILTAQIPTSCSLDTHELVFDKQFVQLNDSTVIISALETFRLNPNVSLNDIEKYYEPIQYQNEKGVITYDRPNKYFLMLQDRQNISRSTNDLRDEREWRAWVDDKFIHAISPNVYRTLSESFEVFNWFDEFGEWEKNFSTYERFLIKNSGALVMYAIGKMLKKKYKLKNDVRESFYELGNEWHNAVGKQFRGGDSPNLADLALYGSIQSFKGCQAFSDLMKNGNIKDWYDRCDDMVRNNKGKNMLNVPMAQKKTEVSSQKNDEKKKRFYFF